VSLSEVFLLGLLGLVILGPKKLSALAPQVGKALARWKKVSSEFQSQLTRDISLGGSDPLPGPALVQTAPPETELVETGRGQDSATGVRPASRT
jgi:Sec-independent protein translocase protein TatA